jgi:hypothetical protein
MPNFKKVPKRNLIMKVTACMLCWLLISCDKFVEVDLPNNQLTGSTVFKDLSTANAAIANLYILLRSQSLVSGSSGLSIALGSYSDELVSYSVDANPFYQNNLLPNDFNISSFWNDNYNIIYAANSIINGLEGATEIRQQDKMTLRAEALFIRAYIHFYLVNVFGAIPYVTSTDYTLNKSLAKLPIADVYAAIIADLVAAKADLPDAYITAERVRVNRSVANALLARVSLYNNNWDAALKASDLVIKHTDLYTWVDQLNKVFLNNSTGTLWQLIPNNGGANTAEAQDFIFTSGPPPMRALNNALLNAFEQNDLRKSNWIGSVSKGTNTWYFAYKYKENKATEVSKEYSILIRLEEMYLIRAEAYARLNKPTLAAADLNKIRNRAGLGNTTAETETELLTAITSERRVEFFTELGHRWFDLKRTGQLDAALTGTKPGWDTRDALWPLPENELRLNPNLRPQNTGY